MLKRDELTKTTSCLNNAISDEPIFVLRSNDEIAPEVVRYWAEMYRARKLADGTFDEGREAKHREALALADSMEGWRLEREQNPALSR